MPSTQSLVLTLFLSTVSVAKLQLQNGQPIVSVAVDHTPFSKAVVTSPNNATISDVHVGAAGN
jgi:hypothetical protein